MDGELTKPWRLAAHLGIMHPDAPMLAATAGSADPIAQIACAARLGFAGIFDNCLKARSPTMQRHMGEALREHGLAMGTFTHNPMAFEQPFFWGEPIADVKAAITGSLDAAVQVGGGCVNVILLDCGAPFTDQLERATNNLAAAAELAAERGVRIALEAVSRARVPLALIERASDVAAVARAAGVGLILDACHSHCVGDDMAAQIVTNAEILAAVQIADMPERVEPGAGDIDFAPILAALRAVGWTGLIEAEFTPSRPGVAGEAKAVAALQAFNSF